MSHDYLWDRAGEPDPEVKRLEELLGGFRYKGAAPDLPPVPERPARRWFSRAVLGRPALIGALALVAIGIGMTAWMMRTPRDGYSVTAIDGHTRVGWRRILGNGKLGVGQSLVTGAAGRAVIEVAGIGRVEVEPNTRIRLVRAAAQEHRLALDRGTLHALVWAPPRLFKVDTPSAVAVDLGCSYTLHVDDSGDGTLTVTTGWVAFERDGRESFVPAGARCTTRRGVGPGTPYQTDASPALRAALDNLDFGSLPAEARERALAVILRDARPSDSLTLWHLLSRGTVEDRARVYDRLAQLVPPPDGTARDAVLAGDERMRARWWNALGFGEQAVFRMFKGPWPEKAK